MVPGVRGRLEQQGPTNPATVTFGFVKVKKTCPLLIVAGLEIFIDASQVQ